MDPRPGYAVMAGLKFRLIYGCRFWCRIWLERLKGNCWALAQVGALLSAIQIFMINAFIKKIVKHAHHNFPEPKVTSSFVQPTVQTKRLFIYCLSLSWTTKASSKPSPANVDAKWLRWLIIFNNSWQSIFFWVNNKLIKSLLQLYWHK